MSAHPSMTGVAGCTPSERDALKAEKRAKELEHERMKFQRAQPVVKQADITNMRYYPNGVTYRTDEERASDYLRIRGRQRWYSHTARGQRD